MGWDEKWKSLSRWFFSPTKCKGTWGHRTVSGCPLRIYQEQKKRQLSKLGPKLPAMGLEEIVGFWVFFSLTSGAIEPFLYGMVLEKDELVEE